MPLTGTYRVQLHQDFGFRDALAIVPYLARLGISHLYLSPILTAVPGSGHGYDVLDHERISESLGGRAGFEALAEAARAHELGLIVDVVPNHMALVAPESSNAPLWQVLRDGRDAATAEWFDIDWKAGGGRLGLPVLGDPLDVVLAQGAITLDEMADPLTGHDVPVLRYGDHVWPVALGTDGAAREGGSEAVRAVLDRQHYRLTSWRDKDTLNYRRFFEVDELIAVRVELPEVFDATHRLLLELNHAGLIDGFRIDHPDGLADPAGYLARLREAAAKGTLIVVEKILEGGEWLPTEWACDGTTGYDALRAVSAALVDTAAAPVIEAEWVLAGGDATLDEAVEAAKRQVIDAALSPEVERLTRRAREVFPQADPERLRAAIVELLVASEVYRAYVRPDEPLSEQARHRLVEAFTAARAARPDLIEELRLLVPMAVAGEARGDEGPGSEAAAVDFAVRLQQTWGPVMAKGVEDTTFYRWFPLIALNEVGGDPADLVNGSPEVLHAWARAQARDWPHGLTALSTHDTKRSEDVRARLLAVASDVEAWARCSDVARRRAADLGVDLPTAHMVWQTILGVGPISDERLDAYLLKALREAKQRTAWVDGDPAYERQVLDFAHRIRTTGPLHEAIEETLTRNTEAIRATVLAQKALQLTLPGVPDVYQGCEILDLSLVDPDNRRPVDYDLRARLLEELDAAEDEPAAQRADDRPGLGTVEARPGAASRRALAEGLDGEKLLLTSRVLRVRRAFPELFEGSFAPVSATSEHALGFVRESSPSGLAGALAGALGLTRPRRLLTLVTRAPARLAATGGWGDAAADVPEGQWLDVMTGRLHPGGRRAVRDLLCDHPVAVLQQG